MGMDAALPGVIMPAIRDTFGFGVFIAGLVGTITFVVGGFSAYLGGGHLADRLHDRKRVLLPSGIGFAILSWLTAVAGATGILVLIRGLLGITAGGWYGKAPGRCSSARPR